MKFDWDETKYESNLKKHGIRFEDTFVIFLDPHAIEIADYIEGEERFVRIGLNHYIGVLVVVFCERHDEIVRIISARRASKNEELIYEERI